MALNGNFYAEGLVRITYNYGRNEIKTDLTVKHILKLMKDWRDYVDAWEKETGKIKK